MLTMPTEPGSYELRYVVSQDSTVAATAPIEVDAIAVTLSAPATALAGSAVPVDWTGPDYASDYIAVAVPGEEGHVNYTYTREGSPALVVMPVRPGTYELRYVLSQGSTTAATAMIEVSAVKATLQAPATAAAGSTVMVDWDGPDYPGDFIGVGVPGDEAYVNYTYTREGSPSAVVLPVEPGAYELRYYLSQGNTIIGTAMIEATAIAVGLVAPASGPAGGTVLVGWDGPDYQGDYIAVGRVDDPTGYESYTYTRDGNPLEVRLPEAPGSYEIRYVLSQRNTPIAAIPFTVE